MSILKRINLKEKIFIAKELFLELVFVKRSLYVVGASLLLSCYIIQTSNPLFYVSSTLREADTAAKPMLESGVATALLGGGDNSSGTTESFHSIMDSYLLAQIMWSQGWGSKVYGNGDLNEEYFNTIPKRNDLSNRLGAFILGYDLNDYYTAYDLQGFIKSIGLSQRQGQSNVTISMMTTNKDFSIEFMNAVILATDQYAKQRLILKSNGIISATYSQLAVSKNSSIASALASTINSEYFKIANLENDLPHLLYIIDPPHSSEYPVAPKASAIFLSSAILFLFASILFSFIQKNKEDLW
tara:strand:- start:9 stop:905 length:897 start_codon:yes stop_codon:yes gene_type:complete